jgi:hypothetical protein
MCIIVVISFKVSVSSIVFYPSSAFGAKIRFFLHPTKEKALINGKSPTEKNDVNYGNFCLTTQEKSGCGT